jgi:hypothetical protein
MSVSRENLIRALLEKALYNMVSPIVWLQQLVAIDTFLDSSPHSDKHLLFLKIQNQVKYDIINKKLVEHLSKVSSESPPQDILELFNKQVIEFVNEVVKEWSDEIPKKIELGDSAENVRLANMKSIFDVISANVKPVLVYPEEVSSDKNFTTLSAYVKHAVINDKIKEVVVPKLKASQSTKDVMELMVDLIKNTDLVNDVVSEIQKRLKDLVDANKQ